MRRLAHLFAYAGILIVLGALAKFHAKYIGDYSFHNSFRLGWTILYAVFLAISYYAVGLPEYFPKLRKALAASAVATIIAAMGISLVQLAAGSALLPRFVVFWSSIFLVPWFALSALFVRDLESVDEERDRILLIGIEEEGEQLRADLGNGSIRKATVVATLDPVLATKPDKLREALTSSDANFVVMDLASQNDSVTHNVSELHRTGIRVRTLGMFYDEWIGKAALPELERLSMMFDVGEMHRFMYSRTKRASDIVAGLIGCFVTILITPIVFAANLIGNRGPTFYRQERVGRLGEPFTILKFRTLHAANSDTSWTQPDDTRMSALGHFMRRTHLDELPQSLNILKGELSLIGPRPEQPKYVQQLKNDIPFYDVRHLVRPGLTGWAQVNHGYGSSVEDAMAKLQYDIWYLRNQNFRLDWRIAVRTVRTLSRFGGS